MEYENVLTKKEEDLGWIIINRPHRLNALNAATIKELYQSFLSFEGDPEVKAVILTGKGKKACAWRPNSSVKPVPQKTARKEYRPSWRNERQTFKENKGEENGSLPGKTPGKRFKDRNRSQPFQPVYFR